MPSRLAAAALLVQFPGVLGLLVLLGWAAADACTAVWGQLRQRPDLLTQLPASAGLVRGLSEAEGALDSATLAYVQHLLPPLPLLLLGLLLREGRELVRGAAAVGWGACWV